MKKLSISLLLIAIMILSISVVSATDSDVSADLGIAQDDDSTVQSVDEVDEAVSANDEGNAKLGDSIKTFTDLKNDINNGGSEIKLNSSYRYDASVDTLDDDIYSNRTTRYTQGVLINKDCTIDGQGNYIDGADTARIFRVDTGCNVVLKNIIFKNAKADLGSAVYSSGIVTLENCTFTDNAGIVVYNASQRHLISIIDNETSYNEQLNDPTSPLSKYYTAYPREDGVDENGNPVRNLNTMVTGHSWESAKSAWTVNPWDPAIQYSTFPWITLEMDHFTGAIVFKYSGSTKFVWYVVDKSWAVISVPEDLGMKDYALVWNTSEYKDKVFDPTKLQVVFIEGAIAGDDTVDVICNESTYNAQLAEADSALNRYYTAYPREDAIDANGKPIRDSTTEVAGHSWESAKSAWTVNPWDPAIQNSTFPWITLKMDHFTGTIVFKYSGSTKFVWYVVDKSWAVISVPEDLGMKDYALVWNTSEYKDKVFDPTKLQVVFIEGAIAGDDTVDVICNESTYNAQLAEADSALNRYYTAYPREDAIDADGKPIRDSTTEVAGHSWESAKSAWTVNPWDPAIQNSTFPWITLKMDNFTGTIVFKYDGKTKFVWYVVEKSWAVISVPEDLGMKDYALIWNTSEYKDKVFDPTKLQVSFIAGNAVTCEDLTQEASMAASDCTFNNITGNINADGIDYGAVAEISGKLNSISNVLTSANLFLNKDNVGTIRFDEDFTENVPDLAAGTYTISFIDDNGNAYNVAQGITNELIVSKASSSVTIDPVVNVTYGSPVVVYYTIDNRTKNVTVAINYNDGALQPPVEGVNYTIDNEKVTIYNLAAGDYEIEIMNNEDANYTLSSDSALFTVERAPSSVTIDPVTNVTYGAPVVVYYTIVNRTNNVTVAVRYDDGGMQKDVDDLNYTMDDEKVTIYNLPANKYLVFILNNEEGNYTLSSDSAFFNVAKADPNLQILEAKVNEYGIIVMNATVDKNVKGNLTFLIINATSGDVVRNYSYEILDGEVDFGELEILPEGLYNYTVICDNDNFVYAALNSTTPLNVSKLPAPVLEVNSTVNEFGMIVINATVPGAEGNVTFIITDENGGVVAEVTKELLSGSATFDELSKFDKGTYGITVVYNGDGEHYSSYDIDQVQVSKNVPRLEIESIYEWDGNVIISILTNETSNGKINVTLYGKNQNYTDVLTVNAGQVTFNQNNVEVGEYEVYITYIEDADFYENYLIDSVFSKKAPTMDVNVTVNNYAMILIQVGIDKNATGNVTFIITDAKTGKDVLNFTTAVDNGTANFEELNTFVKGEYSILINYTGDDYYESSSLVRSANVTKDIPVVSDSVVVSANQAAITLNFPANATGNVTVYFNSASNETFTIKNGTVVFNKTFTNGRQVLGIEYDGDNNYYAVVEWDIEFYVKATPTISVKDVSAVYKNNGKVTVNVIDNEKNPIANAEVKVTVNGKTFKGKTDAKGNVVITVPANFVPKAYDAKVECIGTTTYLGKTAAFKFTVKKATPKIIAKKKTYKAKKKVKKFTITLKDHKGKAIKNVKVRLIVNKVTKKAKKTTTKTNKNYKPNIVKTNKKGKATFKVKRSKKGNYIAIIKFAGNKYFTAISKEVKIKIK